MKLTELNKENLTNIYYENKEYALPLVILLVAVLLFIIFIIPQILSFPTKKNERDTEIAKLDKIKHAKAILETANVVKLDSDVEISSGTLPSEKNFEIVLGAITSAASLSNSQIGKYQFSEGGGNTTTSAGIPGLTFEIEIIGDSQQGINFADQIYKTYPISEINAIDYSDGVSKITITFYYKPFVTVEAEGGALVRDKTQAESQAFEEISKWSTNNIDSEFDFPENATQSAEGSTSPF